MTNEEKLAKHLGDPIWRLNNLYWIVDKSGQRVKFKPNIQQQALLTGMWYLNLILKARQLGMTTFILIFMLDRCLFNSDTKAGVIAHNREDAQKFFREKLKYAYDNLPEWLQSALAAKSDRAGELVFTNGSSITVGTSMRSSSLQYLHISEFGKVCAKYPDKAREIVTGALNAVEAGQFVFIESTAEGQQGYFYDYCTVAERMALEKRSLTKLDYKLFFFPWWENPDYSLEGEVIETQEMTEYFDGLIHHEGIYLSQGQRNWYIKKLVTQGDDMKREFPSTIKEAFEQSIQGAYYAKEMDAVRNEGRLRKLPYEPALPVYVFFDLGRHDYTAMWFMQDYRGQYRFIRYYQNNNESIQYHIKKLQEYGYIYDTLYLPHDANVTDLSRADNKTRADIIRGMGYKVEVVDRVPYKAEAIQAVRDVLPKCYFDEENAVGGVASLDGFKKEWNDKLGVWRDEPVRNDAKHGADAFEQFARGYTARMEHQGSFEAEDYA